MQKKFIVALIATLLVVGFIGYLYIGRSAPTEDGESVAVPVNETLFQQPIVSPTNAEPDDSQHPSNL